MYTLDFNDPLGLFDNEDPIMQEGKLSHYQGTLSITGDPTDTFLQLDGWTKVRLITKISNSYGKSTF